MIDLDALQARHPGFHIQSQPVADCPNCHGQGEYTSKAKTLRPCLCVCIQGSDEVRKIAAEGLHKMVPHSLKK